jgi:hypothetical protein
MARRRDKQNSHVPIIDDSITIPKTLPHGWDNPIKLTLIKGKVLDDLWEKDPGHKSFQRFIQDLSRSVSQGGSTVPAVSLRWRDGDGETRNHVSYSERGHGDRAVDLFSGQTLAVSGNGDVEMVSHHDQFHSFAKVYLSTAIALLRHADGDYKNFGRIVASDPKVIWDEILTFKPGRVLEEESMHEIMNEIIEEIVVRKKGEDPRTLRYLLRDVFEHFIEHYGVLMPKPKHSSWVRRKIHNHEDKSVDNI